jgi:hypothetical protein
MQKRKGAIQDEKGNCNDYGCNYAAVLYGWLWFY